MRSQPINPNPTINVRRKCIKKNCKIRHISEFKPLKCTLDDLCNANDCIFKHNKESVNEYILRTGICN